MQLIPQLPEDPVESSKVPSIGVGRCFSDEMADVRFRNGENDNRKGIGTFCASGSLALRYEEVW